MPREKAIDKLSDAQVVAIAKFIDSNGRNWRGRLDGAWTTGSYPPGSDIPTLQQLRNNEGPTRIAHVTTSEIKAAAQLVMAARATSTG